MKTDPKPQTKSVAENYGDNAHDPKRTSTGYKKIPWCIYFDYLKPLSATELKVRRYSFENPGSEILYDEVPNLLTRLTLNARRPEPEQFPWPEADNTRNRIWRRKSYFAIVIDHPDYWFIENQGVIFLDNNSERNYTLYDGQVERISVGSDFVSAFYCINHMKRDRGGNDISNNPMFYRFRPNTNRPLPPAFYPESGGTNMGPPVGPPS